MPSVGLLILASVPIDAKQVDRPAELGCDLTSNNQKRAVGFHEIGLERQLFVLREPAFTTNAEDSHVTGIVP